MAKFKLELQLENKSWMTLTDYETGTPSRNISFDETLEENENDAYTLTFSVPEYLESGIRTGSLISIGRVLRLTFSQPERVVWFVVNNFQVGEGTENFIYSVSAQDYVSYVFSRNNAGLNLDTIEDQDFWEWMEEKYPAPNLIVPNLNEARLDENGVYTFYEANDGAYFLKYDSKTGQYTVKSSGSENFEVILMPSSFFDSGEYTFSVKYISGTGTGSSSPVFSFWGTTPSFYTPATQRETINHIQDQSRPVKIFVATGTFEVSFTLQLEKGEITNPVHTFAGANNFRPTTVTNIGNYILERGWLKRKDSFEVGVDWIVECNDKTFDSGQKFYQYNISVSDSNSYNALVELANISDTFMRIDYKERKIKFIHRDNHDNILDQNYTLKEGFNLLQSDVAYDGENLYGMFYINGGTDENDEFVTLSDEVRQKDNFLFDFSYFQEKGIISEEDLENINLLIYGGTYDEEDGWQDEDVSGVTKNEVQISTESLYSINSQLQPLIARKYELEGIINSFNTEIIIAAQALMPEGNLASDFPEKYKLLQDKFTTPSETKDSEDVELIENISFVPHSDIPAIEAEYDEVELIFPFRFTSPWAPNNPVDTTGEWIEWPADPSNPDTRYGFRFSLTDPDLPSGLGYKKIEDTIWGFNFWFIWREYESEPGAGYTYLPIVYSDEIHVTHRSFRVKKTLTFDFLIKTFSYYRSMFLYDGARRIREEKQKYIDKIEYFKAEWLKDEIMLKPLKIIGSPTPTQLAEIEGLKDNIDNYRIAIGDYIFDENTNTLTPDFVNSGQKGFYQILLEMFNMYEVEFYESLSDEERAAKPIMKSYRELIELKKTFWFNMKENYGRNIFSEGYYDNEIEASSFDLRAQAELIYKQHKKPNEDFSITYVNMSDVLGVELQEIKVGDYIKINKTNIKLQTLDNTFLQVSAISRTLRSDADISLTITKYNMINSIIEKIVARSQ